MNELPFLGSFDMVIIFVAIGMIVIVSVMKIAVVWYEWISS